MYSQKDLRSRSLEVLLPALLENYDSPTDQKKTTNGHEGL